MAESIYRAPICTPRADGTVEYLPDAALVSGADGRILFLGPWSAFTRELEVGSYTQLQGLLVPGMLDLHTHVPQFPVRGHFADGVDPNDPRGVLLAGLDRNVFPAERDWADVAHAETTARRFVEDARRNGVVGGCAFLTVHAPAAERVLRVMPPAWHAGLVLMDQNCPSYLRNDAHALADARRLAVEFGRRFVMTDRFAVANSAAQRRPAARLATEMGLLTQTHLNEQVNEKRFVAELYPHSASYTHVYLKDGWLDPKAILAHCVQMTPLEWQVLAEKGCVVAHCPTSNARLGSGVMDLNALAAHGIDYAICTDVGASGTTSLLAEMAMYLLVHRGRSTRATACQALFRTTLAPAQVLGIEADLGSLAPGKQLCFVELSPPPEDVTDAETVLRAALFPPAIEQALPECLRQNRPATTEEILSCAGRLNDALSLHEQTVRRVVG